MTSDHHGRALEPAIDAELRLLQRQVRQRAAEIGALLDPGFFEFGASGRRWTREEILTALPQEEGEPPDVADIAAAAVADGVVLVTYVSDEGDRRCLRSSIWRSTADGWRCLFHQGTPITGSA